jgi:hypothetical protein
MLRPYGYIRLHGDAPYEPYSTVIIPQTEPPQTDNTLVEALTSQLHFVTIRKQRAKNSHP